MQLAHDNAKLVLVTGANRGIGFCIVKELLSLNYEVIAISKSTQNLEPLSLKYKQVLHIFKVDLQSDVEIVDLFHRMNNLRLKPDILINNAGIGKFSMVDHLSWSEWSNVLHLNLSVPFYFINKLLPHMKSQNYGKIINIGSNADSIPEALGSAYCASKYGLLALAQCTRLEVKNYNISLITISPGRVDTYFNSKHPGCRPNSLQPEDVAKLVTQVLELPDRCSIEQIRVASIFE